MYCFTRRSQNKTECRGSDKGRHHPTIPADRYQQLKEHFREPNKRFFETIGQDFGWNHYFN